jgi:hypothetical protein
MSYVLVIENHTLINTIQHIYEIYMLLDGGTAGRQQRLIAAAGHPRATPCGDDRK